MYAYRRTAIRRRVVVNLTSGRGFDGVLWAKRGPLLILRNARLLERGKEPADVDGEVVIERHMIEFIQAI